MFFRFSLKEQTSFRTEITVPQIHIYTLKAIIQKVILYYISKDNQSPARSAFFIATGQILSVEGIIMEEISEQELQKILQFPNKLRETAK